jgi:hypothetical protein
MMFVQQKCPIFVHKAGPRVGGTVVQDGGGCYFEVGQTYNNLSLVVVAAHRLRSLGAINQDVGTADDP